MLAKPQQEALFASMALMPAGRKVTDSCYCASTVLFPATVDSARTWKTILTGC
jgi:hypothetical protein